MAQQIFDQDQPRRRSTMAQRLDEAFAGCDVWTVPPAQRRNRLDPSPRASSSARIFGSAATVRIQEPRAL